MCLFCLIGCCPLLPQMTTLMRKQGIGNLSEKAWSLGCYVFKGTYNTGTLFCWGRVRVYHFKAFMQCDDRTGCILHICVDILNWTKNKQTKQVLRTLFVYFDPKRDLILAPLYLLNGRYGRTFCLIQFAESTYI